MKAELHLPNYATSADLKCAAGVDTSEVDKLDIEKVQNGLNTLKSQVDELDADKLVFVPVGLNKLSNAVKNDVVKKDVYNGQIQDIEDKIPNITYLATNTTLNAKINEVKNKIPSITNLSTTAALNAKINEIKNKIPSITNLATNTALTTVGNKIPDVSNLVKKTDYNTEISEI